MRRFVASARAAERVRVDAVACEEALRRDDARIVAFAGSGRKTRVAVDGRHLAKLETSKFPSTALESAVFIKCEGENGNKPLFATKLDSELMPLTSFASLRSFLFQTPPSTLSTLGKATSLLTWHEETRFCVACGSSQLERSRSGHQRRCGACEKTFYPSPPSVILVLVENTTADKVLLVRQREFPPGMFSCPAGFVDVGESLVDAVKREIAEEVGLEVDVVVASPSSSSQHWPYPGVGSLMIGFEARVKHEDDVVNVDVNELEEAKWFTEDDLADALDFKSPSGVFVPPKQALANVLISKWLEKRRINKV